MDDPGTVDADRLASTPAQQPMPVAKPGVDIPMPRVGTDLAPNEPWALRNGRWIVIVGGSLTVLVGLAAVFVLPTIDRLVGAFVGGDLQRARADIRSSGLGLAAGIGVASAGLLTWGRLELSRRQHDLDRRRQAFAEQSQVAQHQLAEQSQRNERFVRAVELMGHEDASVRLGALYALEGLGRDGYDAQSIYDVVCAYVRNHTPTDQSAELHGDGYEGGVDVGGQLPELLEVIPAEEFRTADYEAALTIALRAPVEVVLDLTGAIIVGRAFPDGSECRFDRARLTRCKFDSTSLSRCSFNAATLESCRFYRATLFLCEFERASLSACSFSGAALNQIELHTATLVDCTFVDVDFDAGTTWPGAVPVGATGP